MQDVLQSPQRLLQPEQHIEMQTDGLEHYRSSNQYQKVEGQSAKKEQVSHTGADLDTTQKSWLVFQQEQAAPARQVWPKHSTRRKIGHWRRPEAHRIRHTVSALGNADVNIVTCSCSAGHGEGKPAAHLDHCRGEHMSRSSMQLITSHLQSPSCRSPHCTCGPFKDATHVASASLGFAALFSSTTNVFCTYC